MTHSRKRRQILFLFVSLFIGILLGGYIFSDVQPRSFLAISHCSGTCLNTNELLGLIGSIVVQKFPVILPSVVLETDKTIVIEHPFPEAPIHYVILPKQDIKNAGEISNEDIPYLVDAYAVMNYLIREKHLHSYRIITNGPELQDVTYLHFHLRSEKPE